MKCTIVSCLFVFFCSTSLAGVKEVGNGGGLWVCRDMNSKQSRWIKLVDLFEAETEFKLTLPEYPGRSYLEILDLMKLRLFKTNKGLFDQLESYIDTIETSKIMVNAELEVIDDALFRIRPGQDSCVSGDISYVQIGNYTNYGGILIRQDLWKSISELDKAALIIHEAVYAYLREKKNQRNSVQTRMAVGYLFSNLEIQQLRVKLDLILLGESGSPTLPPEFTQKYFTIGERYYLRTKSYNCGVLTAGVLVLDGDEKRGWKIQVGVQGRRECQASQVQVNLNRRLGPKTWRGDSQVTVKLANGKSCSYPVSVGVSFGKATFGGVQSIVDFEAFYPAVYSHYEECRDAITNQEIYTIELGK